MKTFIQRWGTKERLAILLPLGGFKLLWLAFMGAAIADLLMPDPIVDVNTGIQTQGEQVRLSVYFILLGISALALTSTYARNLAARAEPSRLSHLAKGFASVLVIASLIAGAIFGIGNFMSNLNMYSSGSETNQVMRVLNVYLPILLDAGLLIFVILRSFVANKEHTDDK